MIHELERLAKAAGIYGGPVDTDARAQLIVKLLNNLPAILTALAAKDDAAELRAENEKLRADKWDVKHTSTMNDMVQMGMARDAALAEAAGLREALVMAIAEMSRARGRLETIAMCNEDRRIAAALGGTCGFARAALNGTQGDGV